MARAWEEKAGKSAHDAQWGSAEVAPGPPPAATVRDADDRQAQKEDLIARIADTQRTDPGEERAQRAKPTKLAKLPINRPQRPQRSRAEKSTVFSAKMLVEANVAEIFIEDDERVVVELPNGDWWQFSFDEFEAFVKGASRASNAVRDIISKGEKDEPS